MPLTDTPVTTVQLDGVGAVPVEYSSHGSGRPVLLLHGGGGPQTVAGYAAALAAARPVRVVTPTHPGFAGTSRPAELTTIAQLGRLYAALLDALDLTDVAVVGNSIGGWVAAELALLGSPAVSRVVLVNAVGIEVPGEQVADFFALTPDEVAERAYFDPDRFRIDPAALPPDARAAMASNRSALAIYAGVAMADPGLRARLAGVRIPTTVMWGEADRIAPLAYGRALAAAIPGATFVPLPRTGHLPQLESPALLTHALGLGPAR